MTEAMSKAIRILSDAYAKPHVYVKTRQERANGPVLFALEIEHQAFLVCHDDDTDRNIIAPIQLWGVENIVEAFPCLPLFSFSCLHESAIRKRFFSEDQRQGD